MAYVTGERAFRRLRLGVGPEVLVPRPETEILVEWALEVAPPGGTVLDWGTGSGAIALALADEGDRLRVTGARPLARGPRAGAGQRRPGAGGGRPRVAPVGRVRGGGGSPLRRDRGEPAVPLRRRPRRRRPPELAWEPAGALVSGPTGLEAVEAIAAAAPAHLEPGGWLLDRGRRGPGDAAAAALSAAGLRDVGVPRGPGRRSPASSAAAPRERRTAARRPAARAASPWSPPTRSTGSRPRSTCRRASTRCTP